MRPVIAALGLVLALGACSTPDPVFESLDVSDSMVRGGDCTESRCVVVTAMVRGSRKGNGSCALYGPGDPDDLQPLAENDSIEMVSDEESEWVVELPQDAPEISELNPVCEPMIEG